MSNNIPSTPSELLAMQEGGIKEEINREEPTALRDYITNQLFPEINPDMCQVLILAKRLLEDLESFHYDHIDGNDLSPSQHRIWERDAKNITKALMALRQVAEN